MQRSQRGVARGGRAPSAAALVLWAAATVACGAPESEPPPRLIYDLVESFSLATFHQPTTLIDFGQPATRRFLVNGWFDGSRQLAGGRVGTWSVGEAAEIEFFVARPAKTEVSLRCAPIRRNVQPPWTLSLQINGMDWQTLELKQSMTEYRLELPASLLRRGQNRLRVVHPQAAATPAGGKRDIRVLWDYLRFGAETREQVPRPFARADKGTIFVPFDTRIDFYLELPKHSVLVAQNSRSRGSSTGRLRVVWQEHDGAEEVLAEDFSSLPNFLLPLSEASGHKGRLSFFSLSAVDRSEIRSAGMLLLRPEIRADRSLAEPRQEAPRRAEKRFERSIPPNVVIYLVDTLRADHLGCYGYGKGTSPNIDRFAQDGFLFENAQAQSPWTRASVASIFTGLWPQVHGANDHLDTLSEEAETLAESLKDLGYQTAGITANGNAHGPWGFDQGFDYFKYLSHVRPGDPLATSADVNETAFAWIAEHSAQQPFFLYLHSADPHAPYDPPEPHRSKFAGFVEDPEIATVEAIIDLYKKRQPIPQEHVRKLEALYDAEIAANDESFGRLLDELKRRDLYEGSLIIFLSDHGEEFYEHGGWTHGKTLYAEMLDVPLILKLPRSDGPHRLRQVVQHVDIYPTLLDLVDGSVPERVQGRSLMPLLSSEKGAEWIDRAVAYVNLRGRAATSLIDGSWKVILRHDAQHDAFPELYNRKRDRSEKRNLAPERPTLAKFLAATLRARQASLGEGLEVSAIDSQELDKVSEELRALGYLE